ncbi:MAG: amidohydrolase [Firmicutes bacterium]|nr:amidohydrolase [Bacillota bacterium]
MIVDVHAHYVPIRNGGGIGTRSAPRLVEVLPCAGGKVSVVVNGKAVAQVEPGLNDLGKQLEDMDREGITYRLLSIAPPIMLYELPPEQAVEWAAAVNEQLAADIDGNRRRFGGLATLPLQDPQAAAGELELSMTVRGFAGAQIATNVNGVEMDDPRLEPFWMIAESLGAFILMHPHYVAGKNRMEGYHLRNVVGNPLDTTLAAARLVFGGVMERHPGLRICLSHAGGYAALAAGRMNHAARVRPEIKGLKKPPSEYLKLFYYDTIAHDAEALAFVGRKMGPERVLAGTDYPFDMGDPSPARIVGEAGFDPATAGLILGGTARRLLSIP